MANPYLGEIRLFAGNFAPVGWAFCNGQLLSIAQDSALFTLVGTIYGGDGQSTFALPDLRSRVPLHQASSFPIGATGGEESVTLQIAQLPAHSHNLQVSSDAATQGSPANAVPAASNSVALYKSASVNAALAPTALAGAGGAQPHPNIQPYCCVSFIIALQGIYPSQA